MIKTVKNVDYIVHQWSNVTWAWSRQYNVYGVHPEYEQKFIDHIESLGVSELRELTNKLSCLIIINLILCIWKQTIE